jgi:hypothetical protein
MDAALCFSLPASPAVEGVCAIAGVAAIVTTAAKRRNSRCMRIGHLPLINILPFDER